MLSYFPFGALDTNEIITEPMGFFNHKEMCDTNN